MMHERNNSLQKHIYLYTSLYIFIHLNISLYIFMMPQTQFGDPNNGFLSSGAFAVVANEFVSVDTFFLIGDQESQKQKLNKNLWNSTWGLVRRHPALISDVEGAGQKPRRQYSLLEHVPHPPIHQACSCLGRRTTLPFCWSQADWIICDRPRTPIHSGQILRHRSSVLDNWLWCQCMQRHLVLTALGWYRTQKNMLC